MITNHNGKSLPTAAETGMTAKSWECTNCHEVTTHQEPKLPPYECACGCKYHHKYLGLDH